MLCKSPYMKNNVAFGCGQCTPCRINKRRLWTHRIILESMTHDNNAFVTLTYNDDNLPKDGTLVPKDLRDWQKRLRYHADVDLRFFSVGEYGDRTQRPHYHAAVFGFPGCASNSNACNCIACKTLRASWDKGFVHNGTLTKDSAQYIAGYVTKKMTNKNDDKVKSYLQGRHPEFARMSNRPGIGAPALDFIQEMLETDHGCDFMAELNDVPDIIKVCGKEMLLGSYLKNKLREKMGVTNEIKEEKMQILQKENEEEVKKLFWNEEKEAWKIGYSQRKLREQSYKRYLIEQNKQRVREIEKRASFRKEKGEL
jgi:hypothetical protein